MVEKFEELPMVDQRRILAAGNTIGQFVFQRTAAILVGPPADTDGVIKNGSCFILRVHGKAYLGTARHVVKFWMDRIASGESVVFQVGRSSLEPAHRIVWEDEQADIAFLRLDEAEVALIGISAFEPTCGWPPPRPAVGDFVHIAGYPALQRHQPGPAAYDFRSLGFRLNVKSIGERHLACQFEREYWVVTDGFAIPPAGVDLGGMSGGPVLLERPLAYPLVGLVVEHTPAYEIMRVSTLGHVPETFEGRDAI